MPLSTYAILLAQSEIIFQNYLKITRSTNLGQGTVLGYSPVVEYLLGICKTGLTTRTLRFPPGPIDKLYLLMAFLSEC